VSKTLTEIIKTTTQETYDAGFAAGRAYQAGKDSRALNKCSSCKECEFILIPHAALDEAGKEE
jgi:hypothetical protein